MPLMLIGVMRDTVGPPAEAPPHRQIACAGWCALALDVAADAMADETQALQVATQQNAALAAYAVTYDVLPVALGAAFSSCDALRAYVEASHESLISENQRLAGLFEYSLHIAEVPQDPKAAEPVTEGRAFLRSRQKARRAQGQKRHAQAEFLSTVDMFLTDNCVETKALAGRENNGLANIALLIARAKALQTISALSDATEPATTLGLTCRLIGPCPAYSFVRPDAVHAA